MKPQPPNRRSFIRISAFVAWMLVSAFTWSGEPARVSELIAQLGHPEYERRERAQAELIDRGSDVRERLETGLQETDSPEIRHRLRFILENLAPPRAAVLVVRAEPACGLRAGDIITHVNDAAVASETALRQRMEHLEQGAKLRVRTEAGLVTVGPLRLRDLREMFNYSEPLGPEIAAAVRQYRDGFAEQAAATLDALPGAPMPGELSLALRALIAHTAGRGTEAFELLSPVADLVTPSRTTRGNDWTDPSRLDLSGPFAAPLELELALWNKRGQYDVSSDPDLRVQRIFVPAHRYADALRRVAVLWRDPWGELLTQTPAGARDNTVLKSGNLLAVAAWMFHELDLRSECCRLIEPRSKLLSASDGGLAKWVRVDTDAWLDFFAGRERDAVDAFYPHARAILGRPPGPEDLYYVLQNPEIAARIAFFLHRVKDDDRIAELRDVMRQPGHPVLLEYIEWMLLALDRENAPRIREDLLTFLPSLEDAAILDGARYALLLEYVQSQPAAEVFDAVRERLAAITDPQSRAAAERWRRFAEVLEMFRRDQLEPAARVLADLEDDPDARVLVSTLAFRRRPPESAAAHELLARPLLATPLGAEPDPAAWLILAEDRSVLRFDAASGRLTRVELPVDDWFPNPRAWPWFGREPTTGRAWVYDRARLYEVAPANENPLRMNLDVAQISGFDRYGSAGFSLLAAALDALPPRTTAEDGAFLRDEIVANAQFTPDPDLPELAQIAPAPHAPRVIEIVLRGGPHLLFDVETGKAISSRMIQEALDLPDAPRFFPRGLIADDGERIPLDSQPAAEALTLMLISDAGLIELELPTGAARRIALPGDVPYPALVPEDCPYKRRDPRFFYFARTPAEGGAVFRLLTDTGEIEPVDLVNITLPADYYRTRRRSEIRREIDDGLRLEGVPPVEPFLAGVARRVTQWLELQKPQG